MTITFKKISPMLAVAKMEETLTFYHEVPGFNAVMKSSSIRSSSAMGRPSTS
ncbi:MAG: hypothetical protein WA198_06235 [Candidatus Sulfotelmatobacter sp.]